MLILYNALNGTSYNNTDDIRITTLDDVIYMKMKNDISILLDSNMVLWEQQSSINPNMPARGLMYYANLLSQYIKTERYGIYNKKLIPTVSLVEAIKNPRLFISVYYSKYSISQAK